MSASSDERSRWLDVLVRSVSPATADIIVIELIDPRGAVLPPFTPGAHIVVRCGEHLIRHYSLCGPLGTAQFYRLGIKLEAMSKGGTAWLRKHAMPGATLRISAPRNRFPLLGGKPDYLFISGGIGLTPILPMLQTLRSERKRARLVHLCRSPEDLAFSEELRDLAAFHDVHVHLDAVVGGLYDIEAELRRAAADTEVYCCGPAPVMCTVRGFASKHARSECYHFEVFEAAPEALDADASPFVVELAPSGRRVHVSSDQSMLHALRDAGIALESDCEEGVCGTCALRVVSGIPDHRDSYLTEEERTANNVVMACVSRSRTAVLTVDLQA